LHEVIFGADTFAGKLFDVVLIGSILLSVIVVMLDSVRSIHTTHAVLLYGLEWAFTLFFTVEYLLRLYSVGRPLKYALSFFGIVDLLATLPTWLSLFFPGAQYLLVIRILRVLRIFRILKLMPYVSEADILYRSLRASARKIMVFLCGILTLVVIIGAVMYMIEGEPAGFTSIPRGIYWAIVTMTTVGYGDISPQSNLGQVVASIVMIMGYGIIAVPSGIVTVEMTRALRGVSTQSCPECSAEGHDSDAVHCKYCGAGL
jgi:voltage-gated potassium channel